MNKPTRFYSNRQEKKVAKIVNGKQTANSGASAFSKGDVKTESGWLIECKTLTEPKKSHTIKKEWLIKNAEEAFASLQKVEVIEPDIKNQTKYQEAYEKWSWALKTKLPER